MKDVMVDTSAFERQVEKDYRWNFVVNAMDGGFFWFGASFISQVTILPLYIMEKFHTGAAAAGVHRGHAPA